MYDTYTILSMHYLSLLCVFMRNKMHILLQLHLFLFRYMRRRGITFKTVLLFEGASEMNDLYVRIEPRKLFEGN